MNLPMIDSDAVSVSERLIRLMSASSRKHQQNKHKYSSTPVSGCPHGEFEHAPNAADPPGSPDFITAIAARTCRLPLMPHHRNRCTGCDGGIRPEPGESASARIARRQAGNGRRRSALLAWERGTVACMIYCNWASVYAYVYALLLSIA